MSSIIAKTLITLAVCIFAVVIPILEVNASHVFNPDWPSHARFHEVWQLLTNTTLGLLCLWLAWFNKQIRLTGVLVTIIMGSVLVAHALEKEYGGSVISGNISKTLLGMELAAAAAGLAVLMAIVAMVLAPRQ